jgi:hypothetical protein
VSEPRASILKQIPHRLRFLALNLLAMETILGGLALAMADPYKPWIVAAIVVLLFTFVFIATYIEIRILNSGTWPLRMRPCLPKT